jgi:hypothetical protein
MKKLETFAEHLKRVLKAQMPIYKCISKFDLDLEVLESLIIEYSKIGSTPIMWKRDELLFHSIIYNLLRKHEIDNYQFSYSRKDNKKIIIISF